MTGGGRPGSLASRPARDPPREVAMPELAFEFAYFAELSRADFGPGPFGHRVNLLKFPT